jgi:hypothetical protein
VAWRIAVETERVEVSRVRRRMLSWGSNRPPWMVKRRLGGMGASGPRAVRDSEG